MQHGYRFGAFRLYDGDDHVLHEEQPVALRPKSRALLRYLLAQAPRRVSTAELKLAVWPDTQVSDVVVRRSLGEIRALLRRDATESVVLETRRGAGACLTGPVARTEETPHGAPDLLAGRSRELEFLRQILASAASGRGSLVTVCGEEGMGKSALVAEFLRHCGEAFPQAIVATCSCAESRDADAFAPFVSLFLQLARSDLDPRARDRLTSIAPAWAPLLGTDVPSDASLATTTPEAMIRQGERLLLAIARRRVVILVIEDIERIDRSSLALLEAMVPASAGAAVLAVLTFNARRASDYKLRARLTRLSAPDRRLLLGPLDRSDIETLLEASGLASRGADDADMLLAQSGGSPLLVQLTLHAMREDGEHGREPPTVGAAGGSALSDYLESRLARLEEADATLLEQASVCGPEFTTIELASLPGAAPAREVEARCRRLATTTGLIRFARGAQWADGRVGDCYRFAHGAFREVLAARLLPSERRELHQAIARTLETGHGERAHEIAQLLALHYGAAGDQEKASQYLETAAYVALFRHAAVDAAELLRRAIDSLATTGRSPERVRGQARMTHLLADLVAVTEGNACKAALELYEQAHGLYRECGDVAGELRSSFGLMSNRLAAGELATMGRYAERALTLSRERCPELLTQALTYHALHRLDTGDAGEAAADFEHALSLEPRLHGPVVVDIRSFAYAGLVVALAAAGEPGLAAVARERAVEHARSTGLPAALCHVLACSAEAALTELDRAAARELVATLAAEVERHVLPFYDRALEFLALAASDSPTRADVERMIAVSEERTGRGERYHEAACCCWTADQAIRCEAFDLAHACLQRASLAAATTVSGWYASEIERLWGVLLLRSDPQGRPQAVRVAAAEQRFRNAAALAARQGAGTLVARAQAALMSVHRDAAARDAAAD